MIDKKILIMKFRDFGINYQLKVNEDYINFIERELNEEGFTNDDFVSAIKTIMHDNSTTFGKMPNLAMFIEARPKRRCVSNRPENQIFIADREPLQIENKLTPAQKKALDKKIDESIAKLKARVFTSKKEQTAQKKYWDNFLKQNPPKENIMKEGVLSPQLQKLVRG